MNNFHKYKHEILMSYSISNNKKIKISNYKIWFREYRVHVRQQENNKNKIL